MPLAAAATSRYATAHLDLPDLLKLDYKQLGLGSAQYGFAAVFAALDQVAPPPPSPPSPPSLLPFRARPLAAALLAAAAPPLRHPKTSHMLCPRPARRSHPEAIADHRK